MKKTIRKILTFILVLSFVFYAPAAAVYSAGEQSDHTAYAASEEMRYAGSMLENDSQKYIYNAYLEAIQNGEKECVFDTFTYDTSKENVDVAEYALRRDYPEYGYWVYDYSTDLKLKNGSKYAIRKVEITYDKTLKSKVAEYNARIKAIVKSIPKSCVTDCDKALYLLEVVCDITKYVNESTEDNISDDKQQTAFGPIIYKQAVCEGYAEAYQALLNEAGIKATTVIGFSLAEEDYGTGPYDYYIEHNGGKWIYHAWNIIWLDGKCYYADPTHSDKAGLRNRFCQSREEFDKNYIVQFDGNEAITAFQEKLLGECRHESIDCMADYRIKLNKTIPSDASEKVLKHLSPVYKCMDQNGKTIYVRDLYITYEGSAEKLESWISKNTYKLADAAGINTKAGAGYLFERSGSDEYYCGIVGWKQKPSRLTSPIVAVMTDNESNQVQLKWYKVTSAEKYAIYRATSKNGKYKKIKTTSKLSYTDKDVKEGKNYYYKVKAIDTNGKNTTSYYSKLAAAKVS